MRQRKWLVIPALIAVGCLILLGVLMLLPTPKSGFEPDWLLNERPKSQSNKVVYTGVPGAEYILITKRKWNLDQPSVAVSKKMLASYPHNSGWTLFHFPGSGKWSWERADLLNRVGHSLVVEDAKNSTTVKSHSSRNATWIERTQYYIRKFFGVQEK